MDSRRYNYALVVGIVLLIASGCQRSNSYSIGTEKDKAGCQGQIRSISYCVLMYRTQNDGRFPSSLLDAISAESGKSFGIKLLQCPGKGKSHDAQTPSFCYVNWSQWITNGKVPDNFPIVYDGDQRQHGNGINVVLIDGTVFWDPKAKWLSSFVRDHPQYPLHLPK